MCLLQAGEGRTTIIIAHRLSTVKNADIIAAVSEGHVKEIGTHDELVAKGGLYHTLLKMQVRCQRVLLSHSTMTLYSPRKRLKTTLFTGRRK
jgi:ABC-type transport system involved in cytochrome bd biosynthesis fused ATPase/permease subunit